MKSKEEAKKDFTEMIEKSWTYFQMTTEEKIRWEAVLSEAAVEKALNGSYQIRWSILQAIYTAYLKGIGYTDGLWRSKK